MAMLNNQMVEKRDIGRFSMAMFDNQRVNSSIRTPNGMSHLWEWGPIIGGPCNFHGSLTEFDIHTNFNTYEPIQIKTQMSYTVRIECPGFRPTWIRIPRDTMCTAPTCQRMPPMRRPWQRSAPLFRRASRSGAKENFCDRTAADDGKKLKALQPDMG